MRSIRLLRLAAVLTAVLLQHEARASFTNKSSKEINVKLIFVGAPSSGKVEDLQYLYNHLDPGSKGKMYTVTSGVERTVFFDMMPAGVGEIRGFKVRVHLYTVAGQDQDFASVALVLKGVDGVVFVADCRKGQEAANVQAFERAVEAIRRQGRDWSELPRVLQLNHCGAAGARPAAEVRQALGGVGAVPVVVTETGDGTGVLDTVKAGVGELVLGLRDGRVKEEALTPEERAAGDRFISRVELVSHCKEFFGEGTKELGPWQPEGRAAPFYVMVHPPTKTRPYYTYATFGLSTEPQAPRGPEPRLELIAYSAAESEHVAARLATIASLIAETPASETPFKTYDTMNVTGSKDPDTQFALVPPDEAAGLLRFPDQKRHMPDYAFTHAVGAATEEEARVTFLKLLPLTQDELAYATANGTPALLERFAGRPRTFGWGRGPKESVLAGAREPVKARP